MGHHDLEIKLPNAGRDQGAPKHTSLWNRLPPLARASLLSSDLSTSLSLLKTCIFSWS